MKKYIFVFLCCGFVLASCGKKAEEAKPTDSMITVSSANSATEDTVNIKLPSATIDSLKKYGKMSNGKVFLVANSKHVPNAGGTVTYTINFYTNEGSEDLTQQVTIIPVDGNGNVIGKPNVVASNVGADMTVNVPTPDDTHKYILLEQFQVGATWQQHSTIQTYNRTIPTAPSETLFFAKDKTNNSAITIEVEATVMTKEIKF